MPARRQKQTVATVFERLRRVLANYLGISEEDILPFTRLGDDLGVDSLDMVEIVLAIEDEFSRPSRRLSIPEEDVDKFISLQDIVDYLYDVGATDTKELLVTRNTSPAKRKRPNLKSR